MPWIETLSAAAAPFAHLYNSSKWLSNGTTYVHLAAMLGAGGLALGADRHVLNLSAADPEGVRRHLGDAQGVHRLVVAGLALAALTGVMMFASDVETFAASPWYWGKLGSVALLAMNGTRLLGAERRLRVDPTDARAFRAMRAASIASVVLWFAVTLVGTLLTTEA
jgi:hypothetical protein